MKGAVSILIAVALTFLVAVATCFAEDEIVGSVVSMDKGHITVQQSNGDTRRFGWSRNTTRFFSGKMPVPVKHLMPHTKVRIAPKDGEADAIFLLEVPK